ncbi:hypothetical protein SPRG_01881 [Saprolegnia parasitica CBS 223.65]|uniref:RRM domain-containing protein n=1 Tax=Saprolegnia parasitica (strain CBS 223.65) TaxID=695850 RepID=A0A067D2T6_SAPPC|nr:hypothetical protein SPRG_01881 [Saprolegnia parasitica CBS 223.65]KDO33066.1 hypothetical protein SPRG_01881 [Saprolegnia parasitica CBS 223.65]|eukprot:XP_012195837.1 hypothetical protein SPRG_01881 [Saprolegnia parasitica CBS 223.65]
MMASTPLQDAPIATHRVYVGEMPAWLLNESAMMRHFGTYGLVVSVSFEHDPMSFDAKGFGFLEFATRQIAEDAVAAINKASGIQGEDDTTAMFARMAFARGQLLLPESALAAPQFHHTVTSQRFSQMPDEEDEDEMFLRGFSQRSTGRQHSFLSR